MAAANMPTPPVGLTSEQLDRAIAGARKGAHDGGALWLALLKEVSVSEEELIRGLAAWHDVSVFSDDQWAKAVHAGSGGSSGEAGLSLVEIEGQSYLVSADPWSTQTTRQLSRMRGRAKLALARPGQFPQGEKSRPATAQLRQVRPNTSDTTEASAVVRFVDDAIVRAYQDGASDIHFETDRAGVGVKYRLDGVMAPGERLDDVQRAEEVISRIKVMAQLDITERRRPQDGRIHWRGTQGNPLDLRVSIMPSIFGEDAVLRLLDKAQLRHSQESMSLEMLGFDRATSSKLRDLASRPHGMLLVTGPTGSGKTTTVYAALSEVNNGLEKIVTIEDPVEYELPGVLQIPVNEQKGLTFATGLRSILRHDPDKILVGEIRDPETAEIAVQSALTGHLVFTTVHANSLFDVLGRFQHFGIEPFALASALNGIAVQRLLRRLCAHCASTRRPTEVEQGQLKAVGLTDVAELPCASGCDKCRQTGYKGRFVVAEVHALTDATRDLIAGGGSMAELRGAMYASPSERLLQRTLARVQAGETTPEEVSRVVGLQ